VLSAGYYDAYYLRAQKVRTRILQDFEEAFEQCDALLTPATPSAAFGYGEKGDDPVAMYLNDIFTVTANLAGLPALALSRLVWMARACRSACRWSARRLTRTPASKSPPRSKTPPASRRGRRSGGQIVAARAGPPRWRRTAPSRRSRCRLDCCRWIRRARCVREYWPWLPLVVLAIGMTSSAVFWLVLAPRRQRKD